MNEERWILATLKRWLATKGDYMSSREVLVMIAKIEADAVLGEPTDEEIEEVE